LVSARLNPARARAVARASPPKSSTATGGAVCLSEAEAKLERLYHAIKKGVADIADPTLKGRIAELKAIRDQSHADAERAEGARERVGAAIAPQSLKTFAGEARKRLRIETGGYRQGYLRALAQRVEVDVQELRIMGANGELLRTLVAASSAKTAGIGMPGFVLKWHGYPQVDG